MLGVVDTIPNHIRPQLETKFFESHTLKDKEVLRAELVIFDNNLCDKASQEQQVVSEWKKIYNKIMEDFENVSVGKTERIPLEQFILDNLHPRFVYFSDYKKIL